MKRSLIVVSVVSLLLGAVAGAAVQQGETEIEASGSWTLANGAEGNGNYTAWSLRAGLGYFVTDNIRVGVSGMYTDISNDTFLLGPTDMTVYGFGANAKYHFMPSNQLVPYVGGQIFWTHLKVDTDLTDADGESMSGSGNGLMYGPLAGIRFELNATNDVFLEYQYQLWSSDIGDLVDSAHAVFAGIVHRFK